MWRTDEVNITKLFSWKIHEIILRIYKSMILSIYVINEREKGEEGGERKREREDEGRERERETDRHQERERNRDRQGAKHRLGVRLCVGASRVIWKPVGTGHEPDVVVTCTCTWWLWQTTHGTISKVTTAHCGSLLMTTDHHMKPAAAYPEAPLCWWCPTPRGGCLPYF